MGAKQFVLDTLSAALKIVEGEYDREKDWELFIMARQSILTSMEFVRVEELEAEKIVRMTMDDFMDWLERESIYFYRYFVKTGDKWPMTKAEIKRYYLEYRNERSTNDT